jgi:rSAM/selenodomain-associated transferase 1
MAKQALLIFTKNIVIGKVKTRLAATIGHEKALAVYDQLLKHTVFITKLLVIKKIVYYSSYIEKNDLWNPEYYLKKIQAGNDLGERMNNAFADAFQAGYDKVIIIGTDCPGLNAELITDAFSLLDKHDIVIGPAEDGGYYLLGMKRLYSDLFKNIHWSTSIVFEETKKQCVALSLDFCLLPTLSDVDEEKDLIHLKSIRYE